jgi:hypothetical protein
MMQHANYWVSRIVNPKRGTAAFSIALAGLFSGEVGALPPNIAPKSDIKYISSDLRHVIVFSDKDARSSSSLAYSPLWPATPAKYFDAGSGIGCASIGPQGNTTEYAIKRPFKLNEQYKCLKTRFKVIECFRNCDSAVIEITRRLTGNRGGTRKAYMLASRCAGVLVISEVNDLRRGIPIDAEWLRSPVGILSDPADASCSSSDSAN